MVTAEKPNAPDCYGASASSGSEELHRLRTATMPDAHRNVKHNTPPRAAGGSDADV